MEDSILIVKTYFPPKKPKGDHGKVRDALETSSSLKLEKGLFQEGGGNGSSQLRFHFWEMIWDYLPL